MKKNQKNYENLFINIMLVCILIFSVLGGHVFTEAMSATYVAIALSYKYSLRRERKDENSCCYCSL